MSLYVWSCDPRWIDMLCREAVLEAKLAERLGQDPEAKARVEALKADWQAIIDSDEAFAVPPPRLPPPPLPR